MTKTDLIFWVAEQTAITKVDAAKAVEAMLAGIVAGVTKDGAVTLIGFGTFKASPRAARTGKNPRTGEAVAIAATVVPKFSAGAQFKKAVAG